MIMTSPASSNDTLPRPVGDPGDPAPPLPSDGVGDIGSALPPPSLSDRATMLSKIDD